MANPHVLLVPFPVEGHITPLLELSTRLVKQGFNVTFVSTEHIHEKVKHIMSTNDNNTVSQIHLAVVKDGLSFEDRKRPGKLSESVLKIMPGKVDELIDQINGSSGDHQMIVTCVVADQSLGWALDIAERKGIKRAVFCPAAAAMLAQGFSIPKLIDEGIINKDGTLAKKQIIKISPEAEMPSMDTSNLVWASLGNTDMQRNVFQLMVRNITSVKKTNWLLCNSTYDLEPAAFRLLAPQALPIGPLLSTNNYDVKDGAHSSSCKTCIKWLDQHPPKTVIYIAFGSSTVLDPTQFVELALGLELSNRPFLWVVRRAHGNGDDNFPDGFLERVANHRGMVMEWAPQQEVLRHPSVGCFVSHCGWNSTVEGVSNGVPFLCWPYFADQFVNRSYICEVWRVGLGFERDENGVVTREEIRRKVERVMSDEEMKGRALEFKEMAEKCVKEGGSSTKNFKAFVEWIKS